MILKISINKEELLQSVLIYASALMALSPDLRKQMRIWIGVVLLWYILLPLLHLGREKIFNVSAFSILLFAWFFYLMLLQFAGYSGSSFGNYFHLFAAFDMLIKTIYVKKYFSDESKRFLYILLQITILVVLLRSISAGAAHYGVSVIGVLEDISDSENIASTKFYNMLAYMIGNSAFILRYIKGYPKALSIILIALSYYFMLTINPRAIALFLSFFMIYFVLMARGDRSSRKYLAWFIVTLLLGVVLYYFRGQVIRLFPGRVQLKLNTVIMFLSQNDTGTRYGRITLIQTSLRTWLSSLKNFFVGTGYYYGMRYIYTVGQHCMIADYLAWFGCVGGVFLFAFFRNLKIHLFSSDDEENNAEYLRLGKIIFFAFLINSFTSQPISAEIFVSAFLMYVLAEPIVSTSDVSVPETNALSGEES